MSEQQDNVSDHFPVTVKVVLQSCQGYSENNKTNNAIKRKLPWQRRDFVSKYERLTKLEVPIGNSVDLANAQQIIDE